ncbi:MAG: adenosylcobinamide-GDP ribazoletransferase [bacterium]
MKSAVAALHFLTRIRTTNTTLRESDMGFSLLWYPLVGAIVGLLCGLIYFYAFRFLWPDPVSSLLIVAFLIWVKDAFHLDGLSDLVDGLYGGGSPAEVYEIMKDPALGPFGALAIVTSLSIEYAVLLSLAPPRVLPVLTAVLSLSTASSALLICWGRPMDDRRGLASLLMRQKQDWFAPFILVLMLMISLITLGVAGAIVFMVAVLGTLASSYWFRHRLGGINGDCCGAVTMVVQVLLLLVVSSVETQQLITFSGNQFYW